MCGTVLGTKIAIFAGMVLKPQSNVFHVLIELIYKNIQ